MAKQKSPQLFGTTSDPREPVECLGMQFESHDARRAHFLGKLKEKLKDPAFRKTEGFPRGAEESILALSDPPYYTACPNPFLQDFVATYGKPYDSRVDTYGREPFAADVSSGKADAIYNVHAYPTKVPPAAIMPLIEHYCEPDGIVLDPFCGTGMTGVAATRVRASNRVVLQDLSPLAAHIANALALDLPPERFEECSQGILEEVSQECSWMYETTAKKKPEAVRYYVWSDYYTCDSCGVPVRIFDIEGNDSVGGLKQKKPCAKCGALISKATMQPLHETVMDTVLGQTITRIKGEPVMKVIVKGNRSFKSPVDQGDLLLLRRISGQSIPYDVPTAKMLFRDGCWGDQWRSSYHQGVTHSHQFYTHRNLWILAAFWARIQATKDFATRRALEFWFTASLSRLTRLNRYMAQHNRHVGPLAGTLFIGPIQAEISPFYFLSEKQQDIISVLGQVRGRSGRRTIVSTGGSRCIQMPDNSVDYVFTDPPFGDNLMYSELNFLSETWLDVFTHQKQEAVVATTQNKGLSEFKVLTEDVFRECWRVLKPGRWLTLEFHNSRNAVWNCIQEGLGNAGFVVADVRTLDKIKGTTKQLTQAGTVKQDLIISCYKPDSDFLGRFQPIEGTEQGVWSFVRAHLKHLPVFVAKDGQAEPIAERQRYLLFDRMVAFHVQRGVTVPVSASEFYDGLRQKLPERDGMYFLPEQAAEYDRKRLGVRELLQLELFVFDEATAIHWLKQQVTRKPQTRQELHPTFTKEIAGWSNRERSLELDELLEQNFLCYDGDGKVPNPIHAYLSTNFKELRNLSKDHPDLRAKAKNRWYVPDPKEEGDLEQLRHRALMREFRQYQETKGKLRVVRSEALRAGFKECWQNGDYSTIVQMAKRVPEAVIQEDPALLMYYDNALMKVGE